MLKKWPRRGVWKKEKKGTTRVSPKKRAQKGRGEVWDRLREKKNKEVRAKQKQGVKVGMTSRGAKTMERNRDSGSDGGVFWQKKVPMTLHAESIRFPFPAN